MQMRRSDKELQAPPTASFACSWTHFACLTAWAWLHRDTPQRQTGSSFAYANEGPHSFRPRPLACPSVTSPRPLHPKTLPSPRPRPSRRPRPLPAAGVMLAPPHPTPDGFEPHLGVNFLSHFLLTRLLLGALCAAGSRGRRSRVVTVASATHYVGRLDVDALRARWAGPQEGGARGRGLCRFRSVNYGRGRG